YLHDDLGTVATAHERKRGLTGDSGAFAQMAALHDAFRRGADPDVLSLFGEACRDIAPGGRIDLEAFLRSEASWEVVTDRYRTYCSD
ncbi:DUF3492 domain-containing protein, partial [Escherichia coli]|nr:DUF3492 domain-containing protein [Escherichia coli]